MVVSCNLIGSILLPILVKSHDDPSTLFLSCPRCMKTYGLPMHSSVVAMANTFCPLCQFQVVEIHRVTNPQHPYPVCPHCFNHPPNPRLQEMACFSCAAPACALATGAQDQCVVQFCPCCRSHPMKLKRTKTAKFTVGCVDYPACTTSVWLPSAVKVAVVTTALCPACSNVHQMIYKLRLRFAPGALPPDVHQGTSNDETENGMAGDFTTTTLIRVGVGLAVATTMISFRQMFIRSVFRVLRERLGRSSLLSDVERHFLTSISIALVLLACFVGVVIAGYHNEVSIVFKYAAGVPLVLATRATRIVFTKREHPSSLLNSMLLFPQVKNAVMGFFLLFTEPFRLGSMVIIGASVGVVEQIALHSTKLRAQDGAVVHIPNGVLADDVQRNFSHCTFRRLNFLVHVDHATPLNEMLAVLPHLAETLAPCVIPLEMLLAQEASLRLQDETNDKAPSKAADGDASMSRSSSMHSLLGSLWQPPSKLHRHPSSSSSSTATTSSIADRRDPSTMSTDISEFMLDDHLLHAPSLSTVEATQTDPRLLQVTLGGIHRIWVSALVPGNSFVDVARAKSTVNLAIMRCLERHRVRLHHAPRRRIPRYD
ncbi:hypothetical protein DYB31_002616 [Aphanomyces astaci]|uniref:Mechanosensitive ion channel MscS domain-containing protein n=1 Tax=Aphanomyces astaci TaxID=112090 RepID=A0A397EUP4_APHAT|nr:hypothetical protein DYB31_002616 [Aphanomyces astaci]